MGLFDRSEFGGDYRTVLTEAAVMGQKGRLLVLKETVIIGKLIPAARVLPDAASSPGRSKVPRAG
jgi:hypothetical protein